MTVESKIAVSMLIVGAKLFQTCYAFVSCRGLPKSRTGVKDLILFTRPALPTSNISSVQRESTVQSLRRGGDLHIEISMQRKRTINPVGP
jgi:hypothetical protein